MPGNHVIYFEITDNNFEFLEISTFCLVSFSSNELAYWSFIFIKYSGHDVSTGWYCQTPLFSQNTRMLCLRIVYTAYHAMGNKQKRNNSAFTVQLVKLEPKEGSRKVSRTICGGVFWIPGVVTSFMLFFQQGDCQTPLHPVKLEWT